MREDEGAGNPFGNEEKQNMILETERLYMREMSQSDFGTICKILQDEETMYAYEGAFSDSEVREWIDRQKSPPGRAGSMPLRRWGQMRFARLSGIRTPPPRKSP